MDNKICLPHFHFTLLIISIVAFALFAFYNLMKFNECNKSSKSAQDDLWDSLTSLLNFSGPAGPTGQPNSPYNADAMDDLAVGELPPVRRDYRKLRDPLKEPTRRHTTYPTGSLVNPIDGVFNVPTQGPFPSYQLMGFLNRKGDSDRMLKLFGRRTDRYNWEYYTAHHDDPELKIPLKIRGDKELYQGDDVKVPGFKGEFNVNLYDYEAPKYLPFVY